MGLNVTKGWLSLGYSVHQNPEAGTYPNTTPKGHTLSLVARGPGHISVVRDACSEGWSCLQHRPSAGWGGAAPSDPVRQNEVRHCVPRRVGWGPSHHKTRPECVTCWPGCQPCSQAPLRGRRSWCSPNGSTFREPTIALLAKRSVSPRPQNPAEPKAGQKQRCSRKRIP